jgi:hypothetical protein
MRGSQVTLKRFDRNPPIRFERQQSGCNSSHFATKLTSRIHAFNIESPGPHLNIPGHSVKPQPLALFQKLQVPAKI